MAWPATAVRRVVAQPHSALLSPHALAEGTGFGDRLGQLPRMGATASQEDAGHPACPHHMHTVPLPVLATPTDPLGTAFGTTPAQPCTRCSPSSTSQSPCPPVSPRPRCPQPPHATGTPCPSTSRVLHSPAQTHPRELSQMAHTHVPCPTHRHPWHRWRGTCNSLEVVAPHTPEPSITSCTPTGPQIPSHMGSITPVHESCSPEHASPWTRC